jgi:predicted GIY-YIG superfamily endonuclease
MRLTTHQSGDISGYTSTRLPVKLVFSQAVTSREEALSAEQQIKGWSRAKKEAMMQGDWAKVSALARNKTD